MTPPPVLSVIVLAYNHELYISQTLESILSQETDFIFDVIIGEDHSTDTTGNICEKYRELYPGKVRLLQREGNVGMMQNFKDLINSCESEFIAICEGDDYWTDKKKLQKQVDFLKGNGDCHLCGHFVYELEDQTGTLENFPETVPLKQSFSDFAKNGCSGVYTCSMVFRNLPLFRNYLCEDWVLKLDGGDHLLLLLATMNGESVAILPEYMGVYRRHSFGIWTSSSVVKRARGALSNNTLYILNLPLTSRQKRLVNWSNVDHFTQIIYSRQRNFPYPLNKYINKMLSTFPRLLGVRIYSLFLNSIYHKLYLNKHT